jgi:cytosine/adenosine deaminase-related metal-dependent hydrolase
VLVHAEWVLPVRAAPVRDGAVLVRGDLVADVGPLDALADAYPAEPVERHDGCVLLPGLVNAHTHLALTVLGGIVPSAPFGEWLPMLVRAMRALTPEELEASVALGARHCLESGVTVIGEIAYGSASRRIVESAGIGGVFFWEVLGIEPADLNKTLAGAGYPGGRAARPRSRPGISPHSPYTSGPDLLRDAHARALRDGVPHAIHVAESHAEAELFGQGTGALAGTAGRFAVGLAPGGGTTPVAYLDDLGVLEGTLAIHCVQVAGDDVSRLAAKSAGVALCPRSNAYLHEGPPPVTALERAGARLSLGTDSSASNLDLDLTAEARAVRTLSPELTPERIVRMLTLDGAAALGLDDSFGALVTGRQADLAIFRCAGAAEDPYEAFLERGGNATCVAVVSAGAWRVREGAVLARPDKGMDGVLDEARAVARAALA